MPFTPFHLGPGLFFGIPLKKHIHAPTFILANVLLDLEPFIVMITRINYPLHGYLHTFAAAIGVGIFFGLAMFTLEPRIQILYVKLRLETENKQRKTQFIVAGIMGTGLHVLFDATLYFDIKPFYPLTSNPLYSTAFPIEIYFLSFWLGIFGVAFYLLSLTVSVYMQRRKKHSMENG